MVAPGMTGETGHGRPLVPVGVTGWMLPEGYRPDNYAACRGCGQRILWAFTLAGKKSPHDPDGTSHFATCSAAARFRKDRAPKPKAVPCATCGKMPTGSYPDGSPRYDHIHPEPIYPDIENDRL